MSENQRPFPKVVQGVWKINEAFSGAGEEYGRIALAPYPIQGFFSIERRLQPVVPFAARFQCIDLSLLPSSYVGFVTGPVRRMHMANIAIIFQYAGPIELGFNVR